MNWKFLTASCCFAAMHLQAYAAPPASQGDTIRLGVSLPLTSPLGVAAKQFHEGARVCFEDVNARGGIRGRKIEMVTLDDKFDSVQVVENAKKLLEKDVVALFDFMGTPGILEMAKFTNEHKVPLVGAVSGAPAAKSPGNRYMFVIRSSFLQEASRAVEIGVSTGVRDWGVIYQDDGTGRAVLEGVKTGLDKHGLKPTMAASFVGAKPEFNTMLSQIAAAKSSALFFGGNAPALAALVKLAKEKGVALPRITALSLVTPDMATSLLGDAAIGLQFTHPMPYPFTTRTETGAEYTRAAKSYSQEPVSFVGMEGCLNAKLMIKVLQLTPNLTAERIVSTLETMRNLALTREFMITFGPGDRSGSNYVDTLMIGRHGTILR